MNKQYFEVLMYFVNLTFDNYIEKLGFLVNNFYIFEYAF